MSDDLGHAVIMKGVTAKTDAQRGRAIDRLEEFIEKGRAMGIAAVEKVMSEVPKDALVRATAMS